MAAVAGAFRSVQRVRFCEPALVSLLVGQGSAPSGPAGTEPAAVPHCGFCVCV